MKNNYSPDILNCLANLSSDEVFTSPELANRMLDLLPQELFCSSKTRFLDPCSKSGVFLREITKRLLVGLEKQIPDLQQRIDHIMSKQVFGIACTDITAEMSRRTLYCTKQANGEYSVTTAFHDVQGNLKYERCRHTWNAQGRCKHCGASQSEYLRTETRETYAYPFIHKSIKEIFYKDMQFDVIIGNPPYQMSDGSGGSSDSAMPVYNLFIEQALKIKPKFLCMIVPSKWMVGGRGLQKFREAMMSDKHIKRIVDYEDASDCFPGIHIDGGICYFLWDEKYYGQTTYTFRPINGEENTSSHFLSNKYSPYVIRDNRVLSIIEKVSAGRRFKEIVSSVKPFGIRGFLFNEPDRYPDSHLQYERFDGSVKIFGVKGIKGGARRQIGYITRETVTSGQEWIDKYKLFFTTSYSTNAINPPEVICGDMGDVCTETFLFLGPFKSKEEQMNCKSYIDTSFFKVLLYYGKGTMHVNKDVFSLLPLVDFSQPWTDEMLYKKYNLDKDEIAFIESMIPPME